MAVNLKNKVVLITGASSGFGEDAARLFAQEGCKVVLAARRLERLQELAEEIQNGGGEALAIPVDVNEPAEITIMVQTALDLYGKIDILFSNAGFGSVDWFEDLDPVRHIETLVRVNLIGTMLVTRAVIPHMLERSTGHIINMSSVAGLIAPPTLSNYSASKYGVRAFTDALRREVAPLGIKVTGIYPGWAATEFWKVLQANRSKKPEREFKFPQLSSEYVAKRVVNVAKRPVRSTIIPWWNRIITGFDMMFPVVVDWILYLYSKLTHRLD